MRSPITKLTIAAAVCLSANAFAGGIENAPKKPAPRKYIDKANMDPSVRPGDNFYEYANGTWLQRNEIPQKETRWGSFSILHQANTERVLTILKDAGGKTYPKGSVKQRVGDLYNSGMDTAAIERRGYDPIKPDLERISKIFNLSGVINEITYERANALGSPLFGFGVGQDPKHVTRYIVSFNQGGTSLPDRDYYLVDNARNQKVQTAFKQYISTLFQLTGTGAAASQRNAETVFNIEKQLAGAQMSRIAMRDPNKTYNKFSVADFSATTPHLNWAVLMPQMKVNGQDSVLVRQPEFFRSADNILTQISVDDWKTYLTWEILRNSANTLSSPFVKASFAYSSVLSGQQVQAPRTERVAALVDGSIGDLLGQLYIEKYFPPAAKIYMVNLVNNLKITLGDRIKRLDWMSDETKQRALKKLSAFGVKIAYPDKWQTYPGLTFTRDDYAGNLRRLSQWRYNESISHLGKPYEKRFNMTPPTVNANYSPTNNEITFPAGILQFPFFDFGADDAVNYGGIGAVIGHEMTHGFDDQGRQFDADGTLRDWWTKADADKFKTRADLVVNQYDQFTVLDTIHVKGRLTLGENLADLGGLNIAYEAFKKTKEGHSNTKIDGFTPDQRFFLSWAQVWRSKQRPETAASRILTDPHSPEQYRANAPLTNIDAWYTAFDVKPGDKLYKAPADRIKIW
ncbi:M13 family metallopeptidase [Mucilaginibacter ginkgonis]|nr:M13 family metallopeptidase [Mucilaginibacter ginkgonis]